MLIKQIDLVDFPSVAILKDAYNRMVAVLPVMCMAKMDDRAIDDPNHVYCERIICLPCYIANFMNLCTWSIAKLRATATANIIMIVLFFVLMILFISLLDYRRDAA